MFLASLIEKHLDDSFDLIGNSQSLFRLKFVVSLLRVSFCFLTRQILSESEHFLPPLSAISIPARFDLQARTRKRTHRSALRSMLSESMTMYRLHSVLCWRLRSQRCS